MDERLRKEADAILEELGLDMSAAVNIFVKQLVRQGGMPFTPMQGTNRAMESDRRKRLDSLMNFASQNKKIENGFKFDRDDCYDRKSVR